MSTVSEFYNYKAMLNSQFSLLDKEKGLDKNKAFVREFIDEKLFGSNSKTEISEGRAAMIVFQFRFAVRNLRKSFYECEERDFKELVRTLRRSGRTNDSVADFVVVLKQLMQLIRNVYGYPEGHTYSNTPPYLLTLLKYPPEVAKIHVKRDSLKKRVAKNIRKLPASDTLPWDLVDFTTNKRDACLLAMLAENGNRIGGLATLKFSDIIISDDIVEVYIDDKTLAGEIVVFYQAKPYIEAWLKVHPFRDNQNAHVFVPINGTKLSFMTPGAFSGIIQRVSRRYNSYAEQHNLPPVHVTSRTFRNISTRRDIKAKVPASIIRRQRGWSPTSTMPELYAAISAVDVKDYIKKEQANTEKKANTCSRCRHTNPEGKNFCIQCGEPLNSVAKEMQGNVEKLIVTVLEDDNLRELVFKKLMEKEVEK